MPVASSELPALQCTGAKLVRFPVIEDARGVLSFGQIGTQLPFTPLRFFTISDVTPGASRGEHAHRELLQLFLCLRGSFRMTIEDGTHRDVLRLDSQAVGLYVPERTWTILENFTPDAFVLVLASGTYSEADYIRDKDEFAAITSGR